VKAWKRGENPFVVRAFRHTLLTVGDHQYCRGYCVLLLKEHRREMHDLSPAVRSGVFRELMNAGRAVAKAFRPWKMNYSCYGNQVPHVHWHIFPRHMGERDRLSPPWIGMKRYGTKPITGAEAQRVARRIRRYLRG
jgi:diadenosine tetraphosphate (Ap4A) HIT family hydrolase